MQVVEFSRVARVEGELMGASADHALVGDREMAVEDAVDFLAPIAEGAAFHGGEKGLAIESGGHWTAGGIEGGEHDFLQVDEFVADRARIAAVGMGDDERDAVDLVVHQFAFFN